MADKCPICNKQKGKRSCPALEKIICSRCCYQEREGGLNCPLTCPYFQKAKMTVRLKEIAANKVYYQNLLREFSREPGQYEPFFKKLVHAVAEIEAKDSFLEDVHVIEALYRTFDEHRKKMEGTDFKRETLLNRVGVVQTGIEETILQFKINNKDFTDTHVLVGLNYLLRIAEIEKPVDAGPKHYIELLKQFTNAGKTEPREGLIKIQGG